jgi:hypothetical protein
VFVGAVGRHDAGTPSPAAVTEMEKEMDETRGGDHTRAVRRNDSDRGPHRTAHTAGSVSGILCGVCRVGRTRQVNLGLVSVCNFSFLFLFFDSGVQLFGRVASTFGGF